jgi:transposase
MPPGIPDPRTQADSAEAYGGQPHERWRAGQMRADPAGRRFVPGPEVRACRDLARRREAAAQERTLHRQEIRRLLDAAGLPLEAALGELFGSAGFAILQGLAEGRREWRELPGWLKGRAGRRLAAVRVALAPGLEGGARAALTDLLERLGDCEGRLLALDAELEARLSPYAELRSRLVPIPGIAREGAGLLLAHLGPDLAAFTDGDHFAAWIGLCPGAGLGRRGEAGGGRPGNGYLQALFTRFAHAAVRTRGSWLQQKYASLRHQMVWQKAIIAIARKLAVIVFKVIQERAEYRDRAQDYLPGPEKRRAMRRALEAGRVRGALQGPLDAGVPSAE